MEVVNVVVFKVAVALQVCWSKEALRHGLNRQPLGIISYPTEYMLRHVMDVLLT